MVGITIQNMSSAPFNSEKCPCFKKDLDLELYNNIQPEPWTNLDLNTAAIRRKRPAKLRIAAATSFVCEVCPMKDSCLEYGVGTKGTGVYGGQYVSSGVINGPATAAIQACKEAEF